MMTQTHLAGRVASNHLLGRSLQNIQSLFLLFGVALLIALMTDALACGQAVDEGSTVQAFGESLIELEPQKIRLLMIAKADGGSAREALEALAKHKQAIRSELVALKADRDSIRIMPAGVSQSILGVPKQYQQIGKQRLSQLFEATTNIAIDTLPVLHTATCYVEADWTLPNTDPDMLLQLPNTLRDEIEKRDLVGDENTMAISPEESARVDKFKNLIAEATGMGIYDDEDADPERVQIIYAAKLDADAKARALKQAFHRAREACDELAQASGHQLGRMLSLTRMTPDDSSSSFNFVSGMDDADSALARRLRTVRHEEITSRFPDLLQARIQIRAVFKVLK